VLVCWCLAGAHGAARSTIQRITIQIRYSSQSFNSFYKKGSHSQRHSAAFENVQAIIDILDTEVFSIALTETQDIAGVCIFRIYEGKEL
jgi:hypothetical protein